MNTPTLFWKLCPTCKDKVYFDGNSHLNESIRKNRECKICHRKNYKPSAETKKKLLLSHLGVKQSEETILKRTSNPSYINAVGRHAKRPYEWLYNILISNSKRRNIIIELTYEEFLEFVCIPKCHYCEKEVIWKPYSNIKHQGSNLDRKDSSVGYIKNNCVVCCYECNVTKGKHYSYDEMIMLKPILIQIQNKRKNK